MTEPTEAFVVWAGYQKTSVVKRKNVTNGIFAPKNNVSVKWKGRCYKTKIISVGKFVKLVALAKNDVLPFH